MNKRSLHIAARGRFYALLICVAVALSGRTAHAGNVPPLPTEQESIFHEPGSLGYPEYDPGSRPANLTGQSHVTSNEGGHNFFRNSVEVGRDSKLGGLYVGLGAEQNYSLMSYGRPAFAVLFDYDPAVVAAHFLHRAAFLSSPSIDDFMNFYSDARLNESIRQIRSLYSNNPPLEKTLVAMMRDPHIRSGFLAKFRMTKAELSGASGQFKETFLNDPSHYQYLREMYQTGRIRISMGNLFNPDFIARLGNLGKALGQKIKSFYVSNAPDYQPENFAALRDAFHQMPNDERSLILITTHTGSGMRLLGGQWDPVGQDDWSYFTARIADLAKPAGCPFDPLGEKVNAR